MPADMQRDDQIGKTKGIADHDHDMIHDLSNRLDAVWRYDQYIANAKDAADVAELWKEMKEQELKNVERLKDLIRDHVKKGDF